MSHILIGCHQALCAVELRVTMASRFGVDARRGAYAAVSPRKDGNVSFMDVVGHRISRISRAERRLRYLHIALKGGRPVAAAWASRYIN
jgi:hypothetical protein